MNAIFIRMLLTMAVPLSGGCASTVCMESERNLQRFDGGTRPVYVTNPEMHYEYEILAASKIYNLTNQPDGARRLTLRPIEHYGRCANPLMLTFITLGIVPGFLPGAQVFEYDLETNGMMEHRHQALPIYERISIWEHLVKKHDQEVLAEALAWSKSTEDFGK